MMDEQVLPRLAGRAARAVSDSGGKGVVRAGLLRTFGMGESSLDAKLRSVDLGEGVELGFRTSFPDNFLRPLARASSAEEAETKLAAAISILREHLGDLIYAEGEESMEAVVGRLLREANATLAVAESCTGGLIAEKLTDVPGSSQYFLGGVVAYANSAKTALLDVPPEMLDKHGAVSVEVATAMAEGARQRFGASYGVATTGISGPDGGTPEKPVGLVHVALSRAGGAHSEDFVFPMDRTRHRELTAQVALDWVRRSLLGLDPPGAGDDRSRLRDAPGPGRAVRRAS